MSPNIGYHTRLYSDASQKITGGSFGGEFDLATIERLVNAHFNVIVKPSGFPVFVDKQGREVWLYVTVDPRSTSKGKAAWAGWRLQQRHLEEQQEREQASLSAEIENLMDGLSHEEIVRRLKGEPDENQGK